MNDEHETNPDVEADLDPSQDAQIRALLAELGSGPNGEPLPPEVAARLDDTLALLVAERGRTGGARPEDEATADNVVPLHRRWLPRAAVAAAAVIVLGAGGVFVANLGQMSPGQTSASDSGGDSKAVAPESSGGSSSDSESGTDSGTGAAALPELSATTFASDVNTLVKGRALLRTPAGESAQDSGQAQSPQKSDARPGAPDALLSRSCPGPKVTDGAVPNPVRYDGKPAVLLVHPERAGRQVVEAWNCAGDRKLASTTIKP